MATFPLRPPFLTHAVRALALGSAAVWAFAAAPVMPVKAFDSETAQRSVREQRIYVSVVDKKGEPVETVSVSDLTIREDGTVREVLKVEPATDAMQVAVLVDTSAAASGTIPDLREAVRAFAAALWAKNPATQVALYTFGERPTLVADFTQSAVALNRGINRLFASPGSGAYFIDAIIEAAGRFKSRERTRPIIVAFVDEHGPEFSNRRHLQVFDAVAAARASLWVIARQAFGSADLSTENRERAAVIGDVTGRTGGRGSTVFAPSALQDRFSEVSSQLLAQWAITYGRPESLIPPERLEVRATRDDLRVSAPRWTNK